MSKSSDQETSLPQFFPEWANARRVNLAEIVCFGILIILCLFISITIAVVMSQADGYCLLFADSHSPGSDSICNYCIVCAVMLLVLCAIRLFLTIYKISSMSVKVIDTAYSYCSLVGINVIILILDISLLLLLLVTAILISAGLSHMCESLFYGRSGCSSTDELMLPNRSVHSNFYRPLLFAEGSSWCAFVFWFLVVVFETVIAWKTDRLAAALARVRTAGNASTQDSGGTQEKY